MIPPHLLHELTDLLSPLVQTPPERFTMLIGAFGNGHPILNQLKWTETTENFLADTLNKLDEFGEAAPGKRAMWVLLETLLESGKVGVDKQERIRALEAALNTATASAAKRSGAGLSVFISYARADDEPFVERLRDDLIKHGFKVWWDRASMSNRGLGFLQEIRQAIIEVERVILVFGPGAEMSLYVRMEWEFALSICKPVLTLLRLGDYTLLPEALKRSDVPDFRDDLQYPVKLDYLVRQLCEPAWPLGKLVNVPQLPPQFQARPKDLQAVKDKLLIDASKPVVVTAPSRRAGLQGLGGIGKTVLATALAHDCDVRRAFPDGVLWVTLGQTPSLMARQADLCRALGDPPQTFSDVQQGKARLSELLREKACLLVIDDLWELEHARAFESTGPRGALLITTRDERLVDALGAAKHRVDVLDEEEAQTLMARWLVAGDDTPAYDEPERKAQLERFKVAMPPEAKVVARECGYLPLALTLSAAQVRDGIAWGTLLAELQAANLDFLDSPNGSVLASLKVSIDALERENAANARHYLELAIFPEDTAIPEAAIMTLWLHTNGLRPATAERLLITLGKRSLLRIESTASGRFVRLHDLQHDYLHLALKNVDAVHREFVEAYRRKCGGQWHRGPNDGYYFEHLAYHLRQAGQTAELYTLLTGSPDWMEAKFVACIGDSSYVADLDLALSDFADPIADPDRLCALTKLHTALQVIHARVSVYSDTDLKTLVWLGRKAEAFNHARLRADAKKRFDSLLAIHEAQKARGQTDLTLLEEMGIGARAIQSDSDRASALRDLGAALAQASETSASAVFEETKAVARIIQSDSDRASALSDLAAVLARAGEADASAIFDEAGAVVHAIQSNSARELALRALAAALARAGHFDEAGIVTRTIQMKIDRAWALSNLALALAMAGKASASAIFDEAEAVIHTIQGGFDHASALRDLAAALARAGRFDEARAVIHTIQINSFHALALRDLAAALARAGRFDEARTAIRAIQDNFFRVPALSDLAAVLAQACRFDEARTAIRAIQSDTDRASALSALAAALAQAGEPSANGVFEEAVAAARNIQDDPGRADAGAGIHVIRNYSIHDEALNKLTAALARFGHFDEARAVARVIQADRECASALSDLAAALARASRFDEAKAEICAIQDDSFRASALHALAATLARASCFDEARTTARAIQGDVLRVSALRELAVALAQTGEKGASDIFEEAVAMARAIQDGFDRASALRDLAAALAQVSRFKKAGAVISAIQNDFLRASALNALAAALAQAGEAGASGIFEEAEVAARAVQDSFRRASALSALAVALAQTGEKRAGGIFEEAGVVARAIQDDFRRASALRELAVALAQAGERSAGGIFEEAGVVARAIQDDFRRASALRELAVALAQASEKSAGGIFEEAGVVARAIRGGFDRVSALRDLAAALTQIRCFKKAFNIFEQREADEFLMAIAQWSPAFEKVMPGLSVAVLREVVSIIGWARPDWRKIHELLTQP